MDGWWDEDAVFDAIIEVVASGYYLDEIPGVPQSAISACGVFQGLEDGRYARLYYRGSKEYREARVAGLIEPMPSPPFPPASQDLVDEAEQILGHPLPALLRRLYLEIANGGFGPGYGINGLRSGDGAATGQTAIDEHRYYQAIESPPPPSFFPICAWGCAITTFVDCADDDARMWGFDPNPAEDPSHALNPQDMGLTEWLQRWTECRLHTPWTFRDPVTGTWRSATGDEMDEGLRDYWDPDVSVPSGQRDARQP
jgi:hypothetical protein